MIQTLANAIGTGAVGKLAKQVAGLSTDMANIKTPDKGSGLMFNPDTGKLYIPCGNGVTVNKNTGMLEVPIGDNLRYTGSGLDVPDADETTAGVVKLTHEVSNRDDGEWAVTADGVYAYAPSKKTTAIVPVPAGETITVATSNTAPFTSYVAVGNIVYKDGIYYTSNTVRVRCNCEDWSQHPVVFNPALSFYGIVQVDAQFIDTVRIDNGVPSWPCTGSHEVCYLVPAYTAFAI
jgi:hypothetical protein